MRLERHIGGLSLARKHQYLGARGWREEADGFRFGALEAKPLPLARALHHQLTRDLSEALSGYGWKVVSYSPRGYAQLEDPLAQVPRCSLPKALRTQARRLKCPVGELTYSLFLAVLV